MDSFVPILAYHMVQANLELSIASVLPSQFERQMAYLVAQGYQTVSLKSLLAGEIRVPRPVIITFDDADASVFRVAYPILKKYGLSATVFVISDYVGKLNSWDYGLLRRPVKHLSWDELRLLQADGWEIGSHTATHRNLTKLRSFQVKQELAKSKLRIEEELNTSVQIMSYPFGQFDERITRIARECGYSGGCALGGLSSGVKDTFALHRRGVYLFEPLPLFKIKLRNNYLGRLDDLKQAVISFCAQATPVYLRYIQRSKKT